jgi:transcriptional regulator with PAS, ATPase and Fis domain
MAISISNTYLVEALDNCATRRLLDLFHVGILLISTDGIIRYMNKAYVEMHGLKHEECLGKPVIDIFDTADQGCLKVLQTQEYSMGESHSSNGIRGINFRYPVYDSDKLAGCLVETIFTDKNKEKLLDLTDSIAELKRKADNYEQVIQKMSDRLFTFNSLIGTSRQLQAMKDQGKRFARNSQPILVSGESGTGKELVAQALHNYSHRKGKPFITVNCAAIPQELIESELFGYSGGAFTGSKKGGMKGKFELADTGTIFLDEIGEMPFPMQSKLLRVLESHEIQKIGQSSPIHSDFRLISATNKNLLQLVEEGTFREDLYHRLSILELKIPPLRERKKDISELMKHFIKQEFGKQRADQIQISPEVLNLFKKYHWKGNVRELKNSIIFAICSMNDHEDVIGLEHVPPRITQNQSSFNNDINPPKSRNTLAETKDWTEREAILSALRECGQNKSKAAKRLGIARSNLYKKMHILGL